MPLFWDSDAPTPRKRKENTLDRITRSGKFVVTLIFYQKKRIRVRSIGPFSSYSAAARVRDLIQQRITRDAEWSGSQKSVHVSEMWTDPKHEV